MKHLTKTVGVLGLFFLGLTFNSVNAEEPGNSIKLLLPIDCTLDQDCFIQQFIDMDETSASVDPFCGSATYNGHKGSDIRVKTLEELERNISVLAAADGIVKGVRKTTPDRLVITDKDREAVKGVECGNGVVIDHGNNIETQYCHLKQNSPTAKVGDQVKAGDVLGFVGVSGLSQFPHLHISVRKDGKVIDPFTGRANDQGCDHKTENNWWVDQAILDAKRDAILLDSNISGAPIKHETLVLKSPSIANPIDQATVGWVWYANLKTDDRVFIKLEGPNGLIAQTTSKPMNRNKASWSGYVGKKRKPVKGEYRLTTYVLRNGEKHATDEKIIMVKK